MQEYSDLQSDLGALGSTASSADSRSGVQEEQLPEAQGDQSVASSLTDPDGWSDEVALATNGNRPDSSHMQPGESGFRDNDNVWHPLIEQPARRVSMALSAAIFRRLFMANEVISSSGQFALEMSEEQRHGIEALKTTHFGIQLLFTMHKQYHLAIYERLLAMRASYLGTTHTPQSTDSYYSHVWTDVYRKLGERAEEAPLLREARAMATYFGLLSLSSWVLDQEEVPHHAHPTVGDLEWLTEDGAVAEAVRRYDQADLHRHLEETVLPELAAAQGLLEDELSKRFVWRRGKKRQGLVRVYARHTDASLLNRVIKPASHASGFYFQRGVNDDSIPLEGNPVSGAQQTALLALCQRHEGLLVALFSPPGARPENLPLFDPQNLQAFLCNGGLVRVRPISGTVTRMIDNWFGAARLFPEGVREEVLRGFDLVPMATKTYSYVLTMQGGFFIWPRTPGLYFDHCAFFLNAYRSMINAPEQGLPISRDTLRVAIAGTMHVVAGRIGAITTFSESYPSDVRRLIHLLCYLRHQGCFADLSITCLHREAGHDPRLFNDDGQNRSHFYDPAESDAHNAQVDHEDDEASVRVTRNPQTHDEDMVPPAASIRPDAAETTPADVEQENALDKYGYVGFEHTPVSIFTAKTDDAMQRLYPVRSDRGDGFRARMDRIPMTKGEAAVVISSWGQARLESIRQRQADSGQSAANGLAPLQTVGL